MDILTDTRHVSRLEIVDTGRRRRWSDEAKLRIVEESFSGPRVVSSTARRHGISNTLLFAWRKAYREGRLGEVSGFVSAIVAPEQGATDTLVGANASSPDAVSELARCGRMVIVFAGTRRVIVGSDVDAAALKRVLDVLEPRPVWRSSQSEGR